MVDFMYCSNALASTSSGPQPIRLPGTNHLQDLQVISTGRGRGCLVPRFLLCHGKSGKVGGVCQHRSASNHCRIITILFCASGSLHDIM